MIFVGWIGREVDGLVHRDAPAVRRDQLLVLTRDRGGHPVEEDPPRLHPAIAYGPWDGSSALGAGCSGRAETSGSKAGRSPPWRLRRTGGGRSRRAVTSSAWTVRRSRRSRRSTSSSGAACFRCDGGVLVGTANARMAFARPGSVEMLASFDGAEGRDRWYTPWGGPPDTRSMSAGSRRRPLRERARRRDPASATIPAGPGSRPSTSMPTSIRSSRTRQGRSRRRSDGPRAGRVPRRGRLLALHHRRPPCRVRRAVAMDGEELFMSASVGPRGGRAASTVFRPGRWGSSGPPPVSRSGSAQNIDSHCLAAHGGTVVFGAEGRMFVSEDGGESWRDVGTAYPEITCVAIAPGTAAS